MKHNFSDFRKEFELESQFLEKNKKLYHRVKSDDRSTPDQIQSALYRYQIHERLVNALGILADLGDCINVKPGAKKFVLIQEPNFQLSYIDKIPMFDGAEADSTEEVFVIENYQNYVLFEKRVVPTSYINQIDTSQAVNDPSTHPFEDIKTDNILDGATTIDVCIDSSQNPSVDSIENQVLE